MQKRALPDLNNVMEGISGAAEDLSSSIMSSEDAELLRAFAADPLRVYRDNPNKHDLFKSVTRAAKGPIIAALLPIFSFIFGNDTTSYRAPYRHNPASAYGRTYRE